MKRKENINPYPSKQEIIQKLTEEYQESKKMLYWLYGFIVIALTFIMIDSYI